MRAVVVYESMFGNTEEIARAVAAGLSETATVAIAEVGTHPNVDGVDLLVVGGPTHAFGMSRPSTRKDAETRTGRRVISATGLREWLDGLHEVPATTRVAAFDTRIRRPRLPGSAAKAALKTLRGKGAVAVVPAETFWVHGTTGPLLADEVARARTWGRALGERLASSGTPGPSTLTRTP
ncbi:MAG TPA: flavodoxin domain-containing protein [Acidimicrobiales bacterium]